MTSLNIRGKVATIIVAILCITTIFSIIPVTAFAYECRHADYWYYEYSDITYTTHVEIKICEDCGEEVSRTTEAHLTTYGVCRCGFDGRCDHDYSTVSRYFPLDDVYHYHSYICSFCSQNIDTVEEVHRFVNGLCVCGAADEGQCLHSNGGEPSYECVDSNYHYKKLNCIDCGEELYSDVFSHTFENGVCTGCGEYDPENCPHPAYSEVLYTYDNEWTHTLYKTCLECDKEFFLDGEPHTFKNGVCTGCFYIDQASCPHKNVYRFSVMGYGSSKDHTLVTKCDDCGKQFIAPEEHVYDGFIPGVKSYTSTTHRVKCQCKLCDEIHECDLSHTYDENGKCTVCDYKVNTLPDGVPNNAIPAYVYQDEQGRWVVAASKYFGGYNLLNLLDVELFYKNGDVIEISRSTNEIVFSDSGVGSSVAKYDVLFTIDPGTYVYEYKVYSPYRDVKCFLYQYKSDGSTISIKNGTTFTAEAGDTYRFNFKSGTSADYYGKPFTWRVYDMTITSAECRDYFEPFGVRYFNNELTYELYQNAVRNTTDELSTYAAALDYINNVAYKFTSTKYSDLVLDSYANYLLPSFSTFYTNRYASMLDKTSDEYKMYQELIDNSSGTFNQGYNEGYASAVRDFEGVTEGGMVEGLINGAFNSVSGAYDILGSGVSISGISVSGIVSSIVILLVAFFALKIISR